MNAKLEYFCNFTVTVVRQPPLMDFGRYTRTIVKYYSTIL